MNINLAIEKILSEKILPRLVARDPSLWSDKAALDYMGWAQPTQALWPIDEINDWQNFIDTWCEGAQQVVLIGIGGSSLGAQLLVDSLPKSQAPARAFFVLDTLDAQVIQHLLSSINPTRTRFIVASKSGGTMEIQMLFRAIWAFMKEHLPERERANIGQYFVAITDPNSALHHTAQEKNFARIILGEPSIGGRFSVLSPFGLFPALAVACDINHLLKTAQEAHQSYHHFNEAGANAPLPLGMQWAAQWWTQAQEGKTALQLIGDGGSATFRAWLEQLIAESTGKRHAGLLPFMSKRQTNEVLINNASVQNLLFASPDTTPNESESAGVIHAHELKSHFGGYLVHFFYATALYGALARINPFDQPDVESSKLALRQLLTQKEEVSLPHNQQPINADSLDALISSWSQKKPEGAFVAILDYLPRDDSAKINWAQCLGAWRQAIGKPVLRVVGPAFLHSIGQLFKGADGAQSALFLVLLGNAQQTQDYPIPDETRTFAQLRALQGFADAQVLRARGRLVEVLS